MNQGRKTFSVIIPTRDRPRQLSTCLASVSRLEYPNRDFEVIIVNDGGPNTLEGVVAPFRSRLDVRMISQSNAGPAAARNTGASSASGRYLAFTDDDCMPSASWLLLLERRLEANPGAAVAGRVVNGLPANPFAAASHMLIEYFADYYNAIPDQARFLTSNNLVLSKKRFDAAGGFNPVFPSAAGEDREFCDRLLYYGCPIIYAPEATVVHAHHLSFSSFTRQHFKYGRAASTFHRFRSRHKRAAVRFEPAFFYLNLIRYPLSVAPGRFAVLLMHLAVLSQAANAAGLAWETLADRAKSYRICR